MTNDPGQVPMGEPLAYFLTWTTYGSWLPGDERGWVAKPGQLQVPDATRQEAAQRRMTESALTLDPEQRRIVEDTIAKHCRIRGWYLHAVNCRTQHVHVVVTAPKRHPKVVMDQFKAWCTRHLKDLERARNVAAESIRQNWWTQGGSKRWLNNEKSLREAIQYVIEGQGNLTPRPSNPDAKHTQA